MQPAVTSLLRLQLEISLTLPTSVVTAKTVPEGSKHTLFTGLPFVGTVVVISSAILRKSQVLRMPSASPDTIVSPCKEYVWHWN